MNCLGNLYMKITQMIEMIEPTIPQTIADNAMLTASPNDSALFIYLLL